MSMDNIEEHIYEYLEEHSSNNFSQLFVELTPTYLAIRNNDFSLDYEEHTILHFNKPLVKFVTGRGALTANGIVNSYKVDVNVGNIYMYLKHKGVRIHEYNVDPYIIAQLTYQARDNYIDSILES